MNRVGRFKIWLRLRNPDSFKCSLMYMKSIVVYTQAQVTLFSSLIFLLYLLRCDNNV